MPNSQFYTAISKPRYVKYLSACGNRRRALKLYRANIVLSQKMFAVIGVLEVILRNSIDRHLIAQKSQLWLENSAIPGGELHTNSGCEKSLHAVNAVIHGLGLLYTHDRLISKLTLGFWTYLFAPNQYAAFDSTLLDIFVHRPFGTKQKDIFQQLRQINEVRNRIAHHEPICFDEDRISTEKIERRYKTILELLEWLGCDSNKILYGIDGVRKSIEVINNI